MTKGTDKTPSCLSIRIFLCATPNKLHLIASVFGAFHSSCRFLSGYLVASLTTGPWAVSAVWVEVAEVPCFVSWWDGGGPCYGSSLCSVESNRYSFNFLMVDREGDNLNPGKKPSCLMERIFQRLNPKLFSVTALAFSSVLFKVLYKVYPG